MDLDSKTGDMEWPSKLVWSISQEVQLLLGNIPLIALGVLGLASMTLLMVCKRLSGPATVLTIAMLLAFASGFFGLLSLLQSEDLSIPLPINSSQVMALDVLSQLLDAAGAQLLLLFLYLRVLQLMRDDRAEECDSIAIGYHASEKDLFGVAVKCAVYEALNGDRVRFPVYGYLIVLLPLDIVWRHLLLNDRSSAFLSVYLAFQVLQFLFLVFIAGILVYELARCKRRNRPAWQWIPLLSALILDIGIEVTGFAVHAFTITPLARLMHATAVYIWLVDLLIYLFKRDALGSETGSLLSADERGPPVPERDGSLSVKQLRLMVSSPFRVDTPKLGSDASSASRSRQTTGPVSIPGMSTTLRVEDTIASTDARRISAVGPVIRRASRLPSWLSLQAGHKRNGSTESADAILHVDVEQQAGPAALTTYYARSANTALTGSASAKGSSSGQHGHSDPASSGSNTKTAPSCASTFGGKLGSSRRTSRQMYTHTKSTPSIASSATGTYNEDGIRLDSPIEVAMPFGAGQGAILSPAGNARVKQNVAIASTLAAMEEEDDSALSPMPVFSRPDSGSAAQHSSSGHGHTSSNFSTPTVPPSLFSRQSALSLSYFPRPPSTSAVSQAAERESKVLRRKQSIRKSANGHLSFGELEPPKMPAAVLHQHADSWGSRNTFTGSESSPSPGESDAVVIRGFNVTSFIGAPSPPDQQAEATDSPQGSIREARVMRASSLSRTSAKLLRVSSETSSTSVEKPPSVYLIPPGRFDSLKVSKGLQRPVEIRRNTSENAAVVQEVINAY